MGSHGVSRRTVLKGAALVGGTAVLSGLTRLPVAAAAAPPWPSFTTVSRGYPAAVETGRALVAFGIGPEGQAYHRWQETPTRWSGWRVLPSSPVLKARPIALVNHNGAMSVFVTATNGNMWTGWQPVASSDRWDWKNLGGDFIEEPFPVLNANNGMSVFGQATSKRIVHKWQSGVGGIWADTWKEFPGGTAGRPWVVVGPTGGMVVFARGEHGGIVHQWQRFAGDQFQPGHWDPVPGQNSAKGDPTAVVSPTGAITVFAESDGGITYTWQRGAGGPWLNEWREWTEHRILGRPSVVVGPTGGMALFAKRAGAESENRLIHRSQSAFGTNWSPWEELDYVTTGEPSGVLGRDGRLSAFSRSEYGFMVHRQQDAPGGLWPIRQTFPGDELRVG